MKSTKSATKPLLGKLMTAVDEVAGAINDRFGPEARDARLANANALMLSRAMDLLVEAGAFSEDERNDEMRNLYRKIGWL